MTTKYILYYTNIFGVDDFYLGSGDIFKDCPVNNCYTTRDKNLMPIEQFDALIFHGYQYEFRFGKPDKRSPHQHYIFFNMESAGNTKNLNEFARFYNCTMTYRYDSDIYHPYGTIVKKDTSYTPPSAESIEKRRSKIAWFVSNCKTLSFRENLVREMQKYVDIDIYGQCGDKICSKDSPEECYNHLEENYKFYLSFENTVCNDYVTEKLFYILQKNVVPIVYGGADYNIVAPPNSVIDVSKFQTVPDLVSFVKKLDSNVSAYLEYFEWKKHYVVDTSNTNTLCTLCEKLNEKSHRVYNDMQMWWRGVNGAECTSFPKIIKSFM
ncbi:unnamed protein product [Brassicogethes aeneus]|uniref:Fucosyltransferase n=1 Tax=Brassicogethes aeneus TaxID=1431903 RepID=A0A9P0FG72_BRAAE|nr:unnamed protein product [Brassicogethes aeneus]